MIGYQEALLTLLNHAAPVRKERVPLLEALGGISAADVAAAVRLPSFRNSAMDGFAVNSAGLAAASAARPVTLPVAQTVAAGDAAAPLRGAEGAARIMTGAAVPEPFDAVIPFEEAVRQGAAEAAFARPAKPGENIRLPGEDVQTGQTVLRRGEKVTAERIMLLAALGIAEVEVAKLPDLHIISTGNEIADPAGGPLPEGKIHNSNAPYLLARAAEERFAARYGGVVADDAAQFEAHIRAVPPGCVIVSTGAVSRGDRDFIPESLKRLGAAIHFHRVNIRPGKPVLFATLPDGSWFFGLPGNPVSAAIGFRFFVMPLMRALRGQDRERPIAARLEHGFAKKGDFRQFLKATLAAGGRDGLLASVASGQESFKIAPMAAGNAWVMLEEERAQCRAGEWVSVFPFSGACVALQSAEAPLCSAA